MFTYKQQLRLSNAVKTQRFMSDDIRFLSRLSEREIGILILLIRKELNNNHSNSKRSVERRELLDKLQIKLRSNIPQLMDILDDIKGE